MLHMDVDGNNNSSSGCPPTDLQAHLSALVGQGVDNAVQTAIDVYHDKWWAPPQSLRMNMNVYDMKTGGAPPTNLQAHLSALV
jgi:hypothetical protein